ncbi:putative inorganic phosphate cotransporter [Periplaneta americana]|uniref:putative inorganic phosphate cotransporter n=1 Tax=Periplaneta americana TaxID=6978 RepID=UPI0037E968DD
MPEQQQREEKKDWIPARVVLGILLFSISAITTMLTSSMPIIIVKIVIPPETSIFGDPQCKTGNDTLEATPEPPPDISTRYPWSQVQQSIILSIYHLGQTVTHIPGGLLAEKFGARGVVFWASIVSAVCTALTPICAEGHYSLVIINRFIVGLSGGVVNPAAHATIARWVPLNEKSKFLWCIIGGSAFGPIVTYPLCALIMSEWGWRAAFYITAAIMFVIAVIWFFLMHNTPQQHPRITARELIYIEGSLGYKFSTTKVPKFPAKKVLTSRHVIALVFLFTGDAWGILFPATYGPKFLKEALGFDIYATGGLIALPYLARLLFGIVFSQVTDAVGARKIISTTCLRKIIAIFSNLVPALFLFLMAVMGCNPYYSIICLTLSLGFNGASVGSSVANPHDLAPNFAGTIFGIQATLGSLFNAFSGFIAGAITKDKSGLAEWQLIWDIGGGVYVFTALVFFIWGTGERQPWNDVEDSAEQN